MFLKVECDGLLISFGFKLCILLAGTWAVFARQPRATLPRIHLFRSLVTSVAAVLTFSFWLFYSVKVRSTFIPILLSLLIQLPTFILLTCGSSTLSRSSPARRGAG